LPQPIAQRRRQRFGAKTAAVYCPSPGPGVPISIFRRTFSALDYKTDAALRRKLHQTTRESTVLIVAQRIGTILHADQIIVLDDGMIVGIGRHSELLASCPVYREIAASQLSEEELTL
jgi:ABC-type multidrug transport system fused ATPase/permease subunit